MHRLIPLLALFTACNEYDLEGQDDPNAPGRDGVAVVTPEAVLGASCGNEAEARVTLENRGTGELLLLDLAVTQGSWTVDAPSLPATIAPDGSLAIDLRGSGPGELSLETSDPNRRRIEVQLDEIAGAPPEVRITSPAEASVLPVAASVRLEAMVVDVDGDPTDLEVQWTSDVDGLLGTSTIDGTGLAALDWSGGSPGPHSLSATVAHPCGDGTATTDVCQQGGFVEDELDIENWHFEGSSSWDATNGWLQITPMSQYQVGSAFETGETVRGDDVVVRFRMYMGDGTGADGMSLTVLDANRMTSFLGGDGCGLGFGGGGCSTSLVGLPGYTVEFDTYYNAEVDPTEEDHVAFYVDGNLDNLIGWAATPGLEDVGWHDVEVRVQAPAIEVTIDGTVVISQFLTGTVDFDFPAHIGFTAGTGYFHNLHLVDALEVEQLTCEE